MMFTLAGLLLALGPPIVGGYWFWLRHPGRRRWVRTGDSIMFGFGITAAMTWVFLGPTVWGTINMMFLLGMPFLPDPQRRKARR